MRQVYEIKKRLKRVEEAIERLPVGAEIIRVELTDLVDYMECYGVEFSDKPFAEIHLSNGIVGKTESGKLHDLYYIDNWSNDFDIIFYVDHGVIVFELTTRINTVYTGKKTTRRLEYSGGADDEQTQE